MSRNEIMLEALLARLGLERLDHALAWQAFTHSSYANEEDVLHNERLEFLGDAVLELVTSHYLYEAYPELPEGDLTRMRATMVCEQTLAEVALEWGLGELLLLGKSQLFSGGRERPSLLADAVEALLGAVYLFGGLSLARQVYEELFRTPSKLLAKGELTYDHKTRLQELLQQKKPGEPLVYQVVSEQGPDHDKLFSVALIWSGRTLGRGEGKSKKSAEQMAAREALVLLGAKQC